MKRNVCMLLIMLFIIPTLAMAMEDIQKYQSCEYCGMKRQMFAHSRMLIQYADGTEFPACSLHCAALDFANQIDKMPQKILVADYIDKQLIEAESAVWVMGGSDKGVMTARPKWAFADKAAADSFIAAKGGEIIPFETAMKAAFEDMYKDTNMIRKKRSVKRMKMKGNAAPKQ